MTLAQIEYTGQRMQRQWRDLVKAEQDGQPLEALEQMYDIYILMAEAFNASVEAYQYQKRSRRINSSAWRANNLTSPTLPRQDLMRGTQLAS